MTERDTARLTAAGAARRETMLDELLLAMATHHRRRRRRREAAALAAGAIVTALVALAAMPPARPAPRSEVVERPAPAPQALIEFVRTDPGILERLTARPADRTVRLADDELLAELDAVDRPAGLIRLGTRVWLTADVTGPADAPSPPASSM